MTSDNQKLWLKIQDFRFDKEGTTLTFANRLAKEQGWDDNYTQRVIEEYKKFLFLCCISSDMMTPSEPVDQVWHLHLTYTKSYWEDLCRDTLGKELHHHPTKGGAEENLKFKQLYKKTRAFYTLTFGSDPPQDIWRNPQSPQRHASKPKTQSKASTRQSKQMPVQGSYTTRQVIIVLISIAAAIATQSIWMAVMGLVVLIISSALYASSTGKRGAHYSGGDLGFSSWWGGDSSSSHHSSDGHHGGSSHDSGHGHGDSSSDSTDSGGSDGGSSCGGGCGGGCGGD